MRGWTRVVLNLQSAMQTSVASARPHRFKIVTYNILANKFAVGGMHAYCPDKYLEWGYRSKLIKEELLQYDGDIVCLQEVEDSVFRSELKPFFSALGFEGLFQPRQLPKPVKSPLAGPLDGAAMFYRTSMFRPFKVKGAARAVGGLGFHFAKCELPPAIKASQGKEGLGVFWDSFFKRQEGGVMSLLEHRPSSSPVLAVCTHLFWNPRYPDVKAMQAAVLCHKVCIRLRIHLLWMPLSYLR
ncbi:hypothetical protein CEUSTIGMA_g6657.t1 [Chlamydomonas eustigma]|uniref:Endonuclease/exonuclease/phosphatase domain-containing protein n=1 Tax=Chlamydomonas eustigma TaxID=1157962 RepID=A0A250X825_9CHLO|nr:hypothetical protein CEUSTIGMA_g6657.t1 [Chlamydomonas eustigma]|eukprot:GAX79217.1 hypothetical protein CEUSTIGMA_g6657.t1 [Chlamydomonas eustigma]